MMRKILVLPMIAVLVFVISFSAHEVYAAPSITVSPPSVPVGGTLTVTGTGFPAGLQVYIFLDGTNVDSIITDGAGNFNISFPVPISTLGQHLITVSDNPNLLNPIAPPVQFTIIPSQGIPEFPFSFNLIIIFVAITAVYLVIRQKMTTNFKSF